MTSLFRRVMTIILFDLFISLFAFWFARYFGDLPRWYWLVLSAVIWVAVGVVTRKLQFGSYKRIRTALLGILIVNLATGIALDALYGYFVPGYAYDHSILLATGIITVLEWGLYFLLRGLVYRKIAYFYEGTPLDNVVVQGLSAADKGRNYADNPDISWLLGILNRNNENHVVDRLKTFSGVRNARVLVTESGDPEDIIADKLRYPDIILHCRSLNRIKPVDTLLAFSNYHLDNGKFIFCHFTPLGARRERIRKQSPPVIRDIIYFVDFCWHRIMGKLSLTRGFYLWVTGGGDRVFSRVEVLGRIYRAGFELVYEKLIEGRIYLVAVKVKDPIRHDHPSGGLLIRMKRVGKGGKMIGVYKFRTMHAYSEYLQPLIYEQGGLANGGKLANDYRVNRVGRLMRRFWIDELPMLINWIKGDMKLVGVRPLSSHYFSLYSPELQELRTRTKPGLLPPYYADMPETLEEIQASEKKYLEAYFAAPFLTDWKYFWKAVGNIVLKGRRSK